MPLEQRLDLLTPLQQLFSRVGEAVKSSLPDTAKVKIELETTPVSEVEEALKRTKEMAEGSASSKLEVAKDAFSKGEATPQQDFDRAMQRIEAIAGRIGYLLQKIDSGKDATGNAAQEVERLRDVLEKVAEKGRDAAKALGNEGLAQKIGDAEEAASEGKGGRAGSASIGKLEQVLRNPQGAATEMLKEKLMARFAEPVARLLGANVGTIFGGGMGGGAMAGAVGLGAGALLAGAYFGHSLNTKWAGEAGGDAQRAMEDARLSASVGRDFDLRGQTFDWRRVTANKTTAHGQSLNNQEVKAVLQSMGIGVDGFKGDIIESSMEISRAALATGVSTNQLSSMVGAGIRTGAVGNNDLAISRYLHEIAGATREAASHGITANEKLGVIASLNQKTVAEMGFLAPSMSRLNLQASSAMDATGNPALKGQMGMSALEGLGGSGANDARAREIGEMLDADGNLKPEYAKMVKDNPFLSKMLGDMGATYTANALLDNSRVRAGVNQRAIRTMIANGMNPMLAFRMMGGGTGSTSKDAVSLYGAALEGNDILSQDVATSNAGFNVNTKLGKEASDTQSLVASKTQSDESRKTGQEYEVYESIIDLNRKTGDAMRSISNWFSGGPSRGL